MSKRGSERLVTGDAIWAASPHTSKNLDDTYMRAVSKIQMEDGSIIRKMNFLFGARIKYQRVKEILQEIGFHSYEFKGYTTNCVLSDFQDYVRFANGDATDYGREYLSLEVTAGYLSQSDAMSILGRKKLDNDHGLMSRIHDSLHLGTSWE